MENLNNGVGKFQPEPNAPPMYPGLQQLNLQHHNPHQHNAYQSQADFVIQRQPSANVQFQQTMPVESVSPMRPGTAVIVVNSGATVAVGHEPLLTTCPNCGVKMKTRLNYHSTIRTHLIALILCVTGLFCCAPLPYCMKSCKSLDHYCSHCDQFIGNTIS